MKDINTSYLLLSYNVVYLLNAFRVLDGRNSKYEYCNSQQSKRTMFGIRGSCASFPLPVRSPDLCAKA